MTMKKHMAGNGERGPLWGDRVLHFQSCPPTTQCSRLWGVPGGSRGSALSIKSWQRPDGRQHGPSVLPRGIGKRWKG